MKKLVIATTNSGKLKELKHILAGLPFEVVTIADYSDVPEVEETGKTFEENAILKAVSYAKFTGEITLADDSGLEVDALGGEPGVYSSRFAPTDPERNQEVLDLMAQVPNDLRTARFRCVAAISDPDGNTKTCNGTLEGYIQDKATGEFGFGYDPILFLPEYGKTAAELSTEEKNKISHRGKAFNKVRELLLEMV